MKLKWIYDNDNYWQQLHGKQWYDPSLFLQETKGIYEHECHFENIDGFKHWLHAVLWNIKNYGNIINHCSMCHGGFKVDLLQWFDLIRQIVEIDESFGDVDGRRGDAIRSDLIDRFMELVEREILLQLNIN